MHGGLCLELAAPTILGSGEVGEKSGGGGKSGGRGAQLPSLFLGAFWTGKLGLFALSHLLLSKPV